MTMIRQYAPQPQPQPPLFSFSGNHDPYNSLPVSPQSTVLRDLQAQRQRQLPLQYAYPLQRTNSYPQRATPHAKDAGELKLSENMLRRKTPNGILAAAYDGTSVEQAEKPHAMKHILLPVTAEQSSTNPFTYNLTQELTFRPHGTSGENGYGSSQQMGLQPSSGLGVWEPAAPFSFDPNGELWKKPRQSLPQIDSMLNQIPVQSLPFQYQKSGQQLFGALPPPLQSPLGPTVSNDQGPFGPYWPNGTFIPYRPAAMRDPRYYPHTGPHWASYPLEGHMSRGLDEWRAFHEPKPTLNNLRQSFQGSSPLPSPGNFNFNSSALDPSAIYGFQTSEVNPAQTPFRANLVNHLNLGNQIGGQIPHLPHENLSPSISSGQLTPQADINPGHAILAEFGPHSDNAQLRERVFSWAHSVYIDLLKYLQHTRRSNAHQRNAHGGHHPVRPSIYPKPPRQPGASFSSASDQSRISDSGTATPVTERNQPFPGDNLPKLPVASHHLQRPPHHRASSLWSPGEVSSHGHQPNQQQLAWQQQLPTQSSLSGPVHNPDKLRTLRRISGLSVSTAYPPVRQEVSPNANAASALDILTRLCQSGSWKWIDGILLGGCLAYALGDYHKALRWYSRILDLDADHVEAISNLAATLLALNRKHEAEQHWLRAVKLRPSYFEAVEHLIGLLCGEHRGKEAVSIIEFVERSLRYNKNEDAYRNADNQSECSNSVCRSPSLSELSDKPVFEFDGESENLLRDLHELPGSDQPGFGTSGYAIPGADNGRILALVHAKGNMLYALGDNVGAAKAFENAVLIGVGRHMNGINGLISHILNVVAKQIFNEPISNNNHVPSDSILLFPEMALTTARLCFPSHGELPGLKYMSTEGMARKAAVSTTSNSLLSLAKIFQDGMASNSSKSMAFQSTYGVKEILALYYLSLALQPSPSTANNVGILLASVQQTMPAKYIPTVDSHIPQIPGVVPGSGIALALSYYNYGLRLDPRHAHLFTNLGSLLKDIGQLDSAIKMYESAVACDGNFDIALANLANAVKDRGRIVDAIKYYRRAVNASPDFAEAVCGLANALNSVCGWMGRGGIAVPGAIRDRWHVDEHGMLLDAAIPGATSSGWIKRVVDLVEKQLADGEDWGRGMINETFINDIARVFRLDEYSTEEIKEREKRLKEKLGSWAGQKWEGARLVRLAERAVRRLGWQWYQDIYVKGIQRSVSAYRRPQLPPSLVVPAAPTVLPFHTFTCPMSAKQIRLISQRNGLRISSSTLKLPWLPKTVFSPPRPPNPHLKIGYVSSDFNNHPLAHLMQSVFGMHDPTRAKAYCYATTPSDGSVHRQQIERESPVFYDASGWSADRLIKQIVADGIHILVNLNGYTRGARNEVFAARPAPIHMSFMGFAGTLGAEWCDYLLADETAVPPDTLRPWRRNIDLEDQLIDENSGGKQDDWIYGENIIYCRDTFFCCDHRQSAPDAHGKQLNWEDEQLRRWQMRKELFPNLPDDAIILGNFNQLYKIEPTTFRTWLRILAKVPKAVLWLLRFPDLGESNLKKTAAQWAGEEVANRVLFTDVAQKAQHIARARVCDLFLDTPECNAHTTAADVLWSGTPLLTLPRYKYKMCSRMAASILKGALPKNDQGRQAAMELIATGEDDYENKAVELAKGCSYQGHRAKGRLSELRKLLYESRWSSGLFDTRRWVRDLEDAYEIAWDKWVKGEGGDIWLEK